MKDIIANIQESGLYLDEENFKLILGDSFEVLPRIKSNSIDMMFADPPYFLSNGGITCQSGKMVSVDKAHWDKSNGIMEVHEFNKKWLSECQNALTKDGTIWISGTHHNIFSIGLALQELGFKLLNTVTWYKRNAPPNLSCRYFTHSCEVVIWAAKNKKSKHYFNYKLMKDMNNGKQMRDVWEICEPEKIEEYEDAWMLWDITSAKKSEKIHGKHPTQKPIDLLKRIILSSTREGDIVLDPFNGSGTTGIAANTLSRKYIGVDTEFEYLEITKERYYDNTIPKLL